jgi:hypothetical protein
MRGYETADFEGIEFSVALTRPIDDELAAHLNKGRFQEDLTFAYWHPSRGRSRYTAILNEVALPANEERVLQGNVAFTSAYAQRVLDRRPKDCGVALLHSHLGPGWQGMSHDDVVAERDRLAGLVAGATGLPLLGMTWGTDSTWSARFWLRAARHRYERRDATTVRSVGRHLRMSFHPERRPEPNAPEAQAATISVWGRRAQADLARSRIGIIGLGSVGSIVAEAFSRTGAQDLVLVDHDLLETRNLDRTLGAYPGDADAKLAKVNVSKRLVDASHTSEMFSAEAVADSVLDRAALARAMDCDLLICCVDRPWPRHVLNSIAYAHLIPVIDGGILARVNDAGRLVHVDWRIHTVGPGHACLYCIDALRRSDAALDRDGKLDDPDYLRGLSQAERERYGRRNVFAFSLSVAAHEVLQAVGLISGNERVGGRGPQTYHAYPGTMGVDDKQACDEDCDVVPLIARACDVLG